MGGGGGRQLGRTDLVYFSLTVTHTSTESLCPVSCLYVDFVGVFPLIFTALI